MMILTFRKENFREICDLLGSADSHLGRILREFGYPPMWSRPPGFETLIHIILEQQVSLASAKATLLKLKECLDEVSPANVIRLGEEGLRQCRFSRQKAAYVLHLANHLISGETDLEKIGHLEDEPARAALTSLKGIGDWTADIYLLMALQRRDIFPSGDLAMAASLKKIKELPTATPQKNLVKIANAWRPNRSLATMMLWHRYLETRKRQVLKSSAGAHSTKSS
jgi:DNA-3-methyladenine glycosylase II